MSLQRLSDPKYPLKSSCLVLIKAIEQLAGASDITDIIDTVRNTARDISGADGVCFVLRENDRCHYVDESAIAPLWKGKRFPLNTCVSGWCMMHDQTAVISDVFDDPRVPIDVYRPTFVKSMVVVPLRASEPVGAIGFYWGQTRQFSENELGIVEALGRSTSAALAAIKARDSWHDSEQRLSMALDAGGLGAFEIDLTNGAMVATAVFKAVFGKSSEEELTRDAVVDSFHPDDRDTAFRVLTSGIEPNRDVVFRVGDKHVELRARLVLDVDGRPNRVTGVVRDVTERFLAKERLDNQLAELLRASRLNDLGAMASALAHELNQPLAAGSNYLKAAERLMAKDPEKAMDAMAKAGGQFVRTKEIIQRIRGFVGHGQSERSKEDVEQMLNEVLELARVTTRYEGVQVFLKAESGMPPIEIDKVQIQQVLFNLLRNAMEALEGRVIRQVTVSASRKDDCIDIRVSDTGPGLAPEIAENLFKPFQSTKEGGMGVGLSLCRKIVDSHGGKLSYLPPELSGETGATFVISLPVAA